MYLSIVLSLSSLSLSLPPSHHNQSLINSFTRLPFKLGKILPIPQTDPAHRRTLITWLAVLGGTYLVPVRPVT